MRRSRRMRSRRGRSRGGRSGRRRRRKTDMCLVTTPFPSTTFWLILYLKWRLSSLFAV